MHDIEPFYNWKDYYDSEEDSGSPFFQKEYNQFEYSTEIYGYYIHPQWDSIGSPTLFVKVIYADYDEGIGIIELIGEWNDCIHNDIMFLKRELIDSMILSGISKFILIGENVLNFHHSDDSYYEEWFEEVMEMDGWIALLNFRDHVLQEFKENDIDSFFLLGGKLNDIAWRTGGPERCIQKVEEMVQRRLDPSI